MKSVFFKLSLLFIFTFLCLSCGRKAPPKLPVYERQAAPANLTAMQRYYPRQVVLAWKYGMQGKSFIIERSSGEEFVNIATVIDQHFIDDNLDAGVAYRYRVSVLGEGGITGEAAETDKVSPVPGLKEPSDVSFDISADMVKLTWMYPGDMSILQFNIYRRTESGEYPLFPVNSEPVRGNVFEDEQNFDKTVYFSVRLLVPGDVPTEGPSSAEVRVDPEDYVPSQVTGLSFAVTAERVLVFWDENPEPWVRGYRIYRAREDGSFRAIGTSRTPAFEDSKPLVGTSSYRVSAMGPVSEGPPSEIIAVQSVEQR